MAVLALARDYYDVQADPAPSVGAPVEQHEPPALSATPTHSAPLGVGDSGTSVSSVEPFRLSKVDIRLGDGGKVGPGVYELYQWVPTINVDFWWTARSNYGDVSGGSDCAVVAKVVDAASGEVVGSPQRSAECKPSFSEYFTLSPGRYQIELELTYQGQEVNASTDLTVVPYSGH